MRPVSVDDRDPSLAGGTVVVPDPVACARSPVPNPSAMVHVDVVVPVVDPRPVLKKTSVPVPQPATVPVKMRVSLATKSVPTSAPAL